MNTNKIGEKLIDVIIESGILKINENENKNTLVLTENTKIHITEEHKLLVITKHLYFDGHQEIKVRGYEDLPSTHNENEFHRDVRNAINNTDHTNEIPIVISQLHPCSFTGLFIVKKK